MATIQRRRGFGLSINGACPPKRMFRAEASNSGDPGDLVANASGYAAFGDQNGAYANLLGLLEVKLTSAAANDDVLTTVFLPTYYYEFTFVGTAAVTDRYDQFGFIDESVNGLFACVDKSDTTNVACTVVEFKGDASSFQTNAFIGQSDTSETAGSTNKPYADQGIADGDVDPRVIVTIDPDSCALSG